MLIAGIDEAGYGPLLGPLVLSAVGVRLPDDLADLSLWQLLSSSVTSKRSKAATKLVIADSKKVYANRSDLRNLERSALAAVWLTSQNHATDLASLLTATSLEPDPHLQHQWYCHRDAPLPHVADPAEVRIASKLLRNELAELNAELAFVRTVPVVEARFNQLIDQMHNKSSVLFSQAVRLIDAVIRNTPETRIDIHLDKHGAKTRYLNDLMRSFGASATLEVLHETGEHSAYCLRFDSKTVTIQFLANGESHQLPVAWASIVSKYIRELFMIQFNDYWRRQCPDIKPTAGYWTDAKRFLKDLTAELDQEDVPTQKLVRRA